MELDEIFKYAVAEVKSGNVRLHKEDLPTILYCLKYRDIYFFKQCEQNAYYIPEKRYFSFILENLNKL